MSPLVTVLCLSLGYSTLARPQVEVLPDNQVNLPPVQSADGVPTDWVSFKTVRHK